MFAPLALTLGIVSTKPPAPPIAIQTCKFVKAASFSRGIRIAYKNVSGLPATLVIFRIVHGSSTTEVIDEGTFAPGQTVDHTMTSVPLTLWLGENPNRCAVVHVHFANGTTWSP